MNIMIGNDEEAYKQGRQGHLYMNLSFYFYCVSVYLSLSSFFFFYNGRRLDQYNEDEFFISVFFLINSFHVIKEKLF